VATIVEVLPSLVIHSLNTHDGGVPEWTKGVMDELSLSEETTMTLCTVWTNLRQLLSHDDKLVVKTVCDTARRVLTAVGPQSTKGTFSACFEDIVELLKKEAPCSFQEGLESVDEYLRGAMDFIVCVGKVLGPTFPSAHLEQAMGVLGELSKPHNPTEERVETMATIAGLLLELEGLGFGCWKGVLSPAIRNAFADDSLRLQRNASYALGICCKQFGTSLADEYPDLLKPLMAILEKEIPDNDDDQNGVAVCVDNAASSVCRMIIAVPDKVPIDLVIPKLLAALPLKHDMEEGKVVYGCLLNLLEQRQEDTMRFGSEMKRIFDAVTDEDSQVDEGIKEQMRRATIGLPGCKRKRSPQTGTRGGKKPVNSR